MKKKCIFPFCLKDPDDLPFRKGDVMTVVSKDEEQWWTARNSLGQTGSIPVPYIAKVTSNDSTLQQLPSQQHNSSIASASGDTSSVASSNPSNGGSAVNGGSTAAEHHGIIKQNKVTKHRV